MSGTQSGQISASEATEARSCIISNTGNASLGDREAARKVNEKPNTEAGEGETEGKKSEEPLVGEAPQKKKKKKNKSKSKRGLV